MVYFIVLYLLLTVFFVYRIIKFVGYNHDEKVSFIQRQKLIVAYSTIVSDKEIKTFVFGSCLKLIRSNVKSKFYIVLYNTTLPATIY